MRADSAAVLRRGKLPDGIHPREYVRLLGRRALRDLPAEHAVQGNELAPLILEDRPLVVRPMSADDADHVVKWRARPDVSSQLFSDRAPSRATSIWRGSASSSAAPIVSSSQSSTTGAQSAPSVSATSISRFRRRRWAFSSASPMPAAAASRRARRAYPRLRLRRARSTPHLPIALRRQSSGSPAVRAARLRCGRPVHDPAQRRDRATCRADVPDAASSQRD